MKIVIAMLAFVEACLLAFMVICTADAWSHNALAGLVATIITLACGTLVIYATLIFWREV